VAKTTEQMLAEAAKAGITVTVSTKASCAIAQTGEVAPNSGGEIVPLPGIRPTKGERPA
jgi:hypothetical protein